MYLCMCVHLLVEGRSCGLVLFPLSALYIKVGSLKMNTELTYSGIPATHIALIILSLCFSPYILFPGNT